VQADARATALPPLGARQREVNRVRDYVGEGVKFEGALV
jgi:hypothetical protein